MSVELFEVLIVGGGKAGKTLAADPARSGHQVALVERGMIGGTCITVGCIPTKTLVKSVKAAVLAHKRAVVSAMVDLNWNNLHGALGERLMLGEARHSQGGHRRALPSTAWIRNAGRGGQRSHLGGASGHAYHAARHHLGRIRP